MQGLHHDDATKAVGDQVKGPAPQGLNLRPQLAGDDWQGVAQGCVAELVWLEAATTQAPAQWPHLQMAAHPQSVDQDDRRAAPDAARHAAWSDIGARQGETSSMSCNASLACRASCSGTLI